MNCHHRDDDADRKKDSGRSEKSLPIGDGRIAFKQFPIRAFRGEATCSSVENISAFWIVYRVAFGLTQNQTRYGAVSVQEELRCGACRLKLRLRLRN